MTYKKSESDIQETYIIINIWSPPTSNKIYKKVASIKKLRNERLGEYNYSNNRSSNTIDSIEYNSNNDRITDKVFDEPKQSDHRKIDDSLTESDNNFKSSTESNYTFSNSYDEPTNEENESDFNFDLGSKVLTETPEEFFKREIDNLENKTNASDSIENNKNKKEKKHKRNKEKKENKDSLNIKIKRKINLMLYDYSEVEQDERERIANETINADGFYNEVLPIDAYANYTKDKTKLSKPIIIVSALLVAVMAGIIYYINILF